MQYVSHAKEIIRGKHNIAIQQFSTKIDPENDVCHTFMTYFISWNKFHHYLFII